MAVQSSQFDIPTTLLNEIHNFDWKETFMIEESIQQDLWNNFSTENKLSLEKTYRDLSLPNECSKHYMAYNPVLDPESQKILDYFDDKIYRYNFLKLTAGYNLWWHYDLYSTFVKYNNISEKDSDEIHRTIIMLSDWSPGQVFQIEDNCITKWNIGTSFTWKSNTWHGVGNFSFADFITMQITWIKK